MKNLLFALILVFAGAQLMAQSDNDYTEVMRSVLVTEKKAAITEIMALTETESTVFWPLYNEFSNKMYTVQTKRIKIIKEFAENYETMTNEKADEIWISYMGYKKEIATLNKQYYKKFKKLMPAAKVVKYFQAENKIATLIDYELATEIPFIENK